MSKINDLEPQSDSAVFLNNVSVEFSVPNEPIKTFKEYSIRLIQGKIRREKFFALKNINLDIKKGEIFGILGRNGAGKSTLLKVVSRVIVPSEGRVWIKGAISPLLQLGAGFHPELTGLENIFVNATLLGHSYNEVDEKIDRIIDFAEIGKFIEAPIRTYSSGMKARLGFAIATAWKPDILVLDEVLSVGDVAFRKKCFSRMDNYRESGATVLLVSHSIGQIKELCKRAMWLDHGEIIEMGPVDDVCEAYSHALLK
jgi:ABC-type polysaccharide/polyol phosphate transport system ATPase subunit